MTQNSSMVLNSRLDPAILVVLLLFAIALVLAIGVFAADYKQTLRSK